MATTTMTPRAQARRSTVAKKITMAVTGLILIAFLLGHMYGNLKAFQGPEAFDHYADWLKGDILYPLLPKGWFIWILRIGLLAAVALHIWSAAVLSGRMLASRGRYKRPLVRKAETYSARTMRVGGTIVLLFLLFHLAQFTLKWLNIGFPTNATPYAMVVATFQMPVMVILYGISLIAVCMHVRHGFWSAFTTLGANTGASARALLNGLAVFVAVLLYVGFMVMPISVLLGLVK